MTFLSLPLSWKTTGTAYDVVLEIMLAYYRDLLVAREGGGSMLINSDKKIL